MQANIVYQTMLNENLRLHIGKLEEAMNKIQSRILAELRLKDTLKKQLAVCKSTIPDTT